MDYGKLSIVVTIYNDEKTLNRCLDSLINQSYRNIEVILVNDGSQDDSQKIIDEYCKKNAMFKCIINPKNLGLFKTRVVGSKKATGKYIAFLDSGDYASIDFYRNLVFNMEKNNSDMVMGNVVIELNENKRKIYSVSDFNFSELTDKEIMDCYFKQEGLNYLWYAIWNKVYKMELWKKSLPYFEKLIEEFTFPEDLIFSTVLVNFAKKITKVSTDAIFCCKQDTGTSTTWKDINNKTIEKRINDLTISFNFVVNFLKQEKIYNKYKKNINNWKCLYKNQYKVNINNLKMSDSDKENLLNLLEKYSVENKKINKPSYFQDYMTYWNEKLEEFKKEICNPSIKCISFDIFDTLVTRPFYYPSDLFILLNKHFETLTKNRGIDFQKLRVAAEKEARYENNYQEVTLDEIYKVLNKNYGIDNKILDEMKKLEIESELKYCKTRNTAFELYELAKYLGKKVICTSDMYLPLNVIEEILIKNGYTEIDKIFLSCDVKKTKSNGNLYEYMLKEMNLKASEVIHVGDTYVVDIEKAKEYGIKTLFLMKARDVFIDKNETNSLGQVFTEDIPSWVDNVASIDFFGIRTMIAVVANKYFDNPYRSFNRDTDFNMDAYLIGYYALGMHLFGVAKWLLDNCKTKKYDNIIFMARDGYLPMEAYKILKPLYKNVAEEKYFYTSRKASIPFIIKEKLDFYKLSNFFYWGNKTPRQVVELLSNVIEVDETKLEKICKEKKISLNTNFQNENMFFEFLSVLSQNFFDEKKHNAKVKELKKYFEEIFDGNSCAFDIGYSARIEYYLSNYLNKKIDTYFINISTDEPLNYSCDGEFSLETFYEYKPKITGFIRELLFSKSAPSCIDYKIEKGKVEPVFEGYETTYTSEFLINTIQRGALDFVFDMVTIFGDDMFKLTYQNNYISLPYDMFIQSSSLNDRRIMDCIDFEDDVRGQTISIYEEWNNRLKKHNQYSLDTLLNLKNTGETNNINLYGKNILERMVYYAVFDRKAFKNKIKKRIKK